MGGIPGGLRREHRFRPRSFPDSVILSEVVVREANDDAVERPLPSQPCKHCHKAFSQRSQSRGENSLHHSLRRKGAQLPRYARDFGARLRRRASASTSAPREDSLRESSPCAKDDKGYKFAAKKNARGAGGVSRSLTGLVPKYKIYKDFSSKSLFFKDPAAVTR